MKRGFALVVLLAVGGLTIFVAMELQRPSGARVRAELARAARGRETPPLWQR
jgi:hypothetical protein